jgi:hypothetical protein
MTRPSRLLSLVMHQALRISCLPPPCLLLLWLPYQDQLPGSPARARLLSLFRGVRKALKRTLRLSFLSCPMPSPLVEAATGGESTEIWDIHLTGKASRRPILITTDIIIIMDVEVIMLPSHELFGQWMSRQDVSLLFVACVLYIGN